MIDPVPRDDPPARAVAVLDPGQRRVVDEREDAAGGAARGEAADVGERVVRLALKPAHEHLAVEAGTGVGKSLAYLVPAILFAIANKKKAVIS